MTRRAWVWAFLSVTGLALAMEVAAAILDSRNTPTWTDLITENVHWEVFAVAYGGFVVWLGAHFGVRYWRRHRPPRT